MTHNPNPGGKGPKVTKQSDNKGPIIGKMTSVTGTTRPWAPSMGTNKGLKNAGNNNKKS